MCNKRIPRFLWTMMVLIVLILIIATSVSAKEARLTVTGATHAFEKNSHYEISASTKSNEAPLGVLSLSGDMTEDGSMGNYRKYTVNQGNFSICYTFDPDAFPEDATAWHISDDKTKQVNDVKLEKNILAGALIVQSSRDGELWQTDVSLTNIFAQDNEHQNPVFTANDIQLQNGCYYRVIVAYKLERQADSTKILGFQKENFEHKKIAEVYEFYAVTDDTTKISSPAETPRCEMGETIKTEKDSGYTGDLVIDKDDPHFDMKLGTFVINGYTRKTNDDDIPVFLKNTGDRVTLWFALEQDINCLGGDETLSVCEDTNGYEVHSNPNLAVKQTNLKHGALVIRVADHEGNTQKPIVYTDFLAANARTGADTKVQLFEEGDYEVSLLYEIEKDNIQVGSVKTAPTYTNYKVTFKFKIRNGNCIVFPFDSATGRELSDGAITPNGFRLDMAKSKYLTIDVQRAVINVGRDGTLSTDIRFNRPAKDGAVYSDEGIYTVTAKNSYTGGAETVKTFYVGSEKYMAAMSQHGYSLEELNALIREGATIEEDGSVTMPPLPVESTSPVTEKTLPPETEVVTEATETKPVSVVETEAEEDVEGVAMADHPENGNGVPYTVYGAAIAVVVAVGFFVVRLKKRKPSGDTEQ